LLSSIRHLRIPFIFLALPGAIPPHPSHPSECGAKAGNLQIAPR
jgi:hypothetical protein